MDAALLHALTVQFTQNMYCCTVTEKSHVTPQAKQKEKCKNLMNMITGIWSCSVETEQLERMNVRKVICVLGSSTW